MTTPPSSVLLLQGAQAVWQRRGILWAIYGFNLLLVLPLVLTLRVVIVNAVGSSPLIDSLLAGYDHTIYKDILRNHAEIYELVVRSIIPLVMISLIVNSLLGPGVVASFDGDGGVRQFLRDTARYFWRSIRLLLTVFSAIVLALILVLFLAGIAWMMMTEGNRVESEYLFASLVTVLIVGLPIVLIILFAEYAKIFLVRDDMSSVVRAFWKGLVFVVRHPLRMLALHGTVSLALILGICAYWFVDDVVGMTSVAGIFVMLLVQQASVLMRVFTRVWNTANGVGLVSSSETVEPVVSLVEPATVTQQPSLELPMPDVVSAPRRTPSAVRRSKVGSRRMGIRPTRTHRRPRRGRNR